MGKKMSEICRQAIEDDSSWHASDLVAERRWEFFIDEHQRRELECALEDVNRSGLPLAQITATDFRLPTLGGVLSTLSSELRDGRGFALIRDFPVEGHSYADLEKMYWGLCSHIGTGVTQNSDLGFIHYVTDGALRPRQGTRGVGFPTETPLHVDLTDVASLLCIRQAPDDPPSRIASSTAIYNEILRQRPDSLERLYSGFEWDRMGEHGDGESATSGFRVPLFSAADGLVSCQYNRNWMSSAANRKQTPMTPVEVEVLDLIDGLARELCFEFPFHQGDIQFCNNYTVMHGRAAHEVVDEQDSKRVLMRIWLEVDDFRGFSDEAIVRYGIGTHGSLGWTAQDLLAARNELPRLRRTDGAVQLR
ncbi:MAG: hypothetical protein ACI915_004829 [Gammaproteobacteria bacterium]|jgi:hypothetical protein